MDARTHRHTRYHLLDVLRFAAALVVVVFHYHYLMTVPEVLAVPAEGIRSQPLWSVLAPIYLHGVQAVPLFWMLSGFLFFDLYAEPIRTGAHSGWRFFVNRFSRLYPLHLATLLLVAAVQMFATARFGGPFFYDHNDLYHFGLQLALASHWGLERGTSFNEPIWSVSLEVIAYLAFFAFALRLVPRPATLLPVIAVGLALWQAGNHIGYALFCFFLGGLLHWGVARVRAPLWVGLGLALAGSGYVLASVVWPWLVAGPLVVILVMPVLLVGLALVQAARPDWGRRVGWLGDMTYSSYLIHVPLMMVFLTLAKLAGWQILPQSPWFLAGYLAVILLMSRACFLWFERPAQDWLRQGLLARRKPVAGVTSGAVRLPGDQANAPR